MKKKARTGSMTGFHRKGDQPRVLERGPRDSIPPTGYTKTMLRNDVKSHREALGPVDGKRLTRSDVLMFRHYK